MQDHGSEFTPDELDRLEDALERLGDRVSGELAAELEGSPRLRGRLDEYAAILALTRDAMPLEDVPPGLLDGVLAEARQQALPAEKAGQQRSRPGPSLWERLRRSLLLPGVALAGTAAVLLWVVRPDTIAEEAPTRRSEAAPAPAAPEALRAVSPAPVPTDMAPEPPEEKASLADDAKDTPAAEAAIEAPPPAAMARPTRSGAGAPGKAKKADAEAQLPGLGVPEEARVDGDKESFRDQLDRGDAARDRDRCDLAQAEYTAVAVSNAPASERARALAGLGLCREAAGRTADAERYFREARALDPHVDRLIKREGEASLKRAAKAKAAKATADGL